MVREQGELRRRRLHCLHCTHTSRTCWVLQLFVQSLISSGLGGGFHQRLSAHTDLITIRGRLLSNGSQKYEQTEQSRHNEHIQQQHRAACFSVSAEFEALREAQSLFTTKIHLKAACDSLCVFVFSRSIHATVISIVVQPVAGGVALSARRLKLLSCQLCFSLQAR